MTIVRHCSLRVFLLPLVLLSVAGLTVYLVLPTAYYNRESFVRYTYRSNEKPEDNRTSFSEQQLIDEIEKTATNLPMKFWRKHQSGGLKLNGSCARFPNVFDIQFNNLYWQTLNTSNGTFQLLNAFMDDRIGPTVRILGMFNKLNPTVTTYCQLWYEDQNFTVVTKSSNYLYIWRKEWSMYKKDDYEGYLVTCKIPPGSVPVAVSLVEKQCDTSTNLLKINNKPANSSKKDFVVCVKGLDFPSIDITSRLVEWIELLTILGADLIHFYKLNIHPNVERLLQYYAKQGNVQVTPFEIAGGQPNLPALRSYYLQKRLHRKRINEVIPYNDCFYRHMHEYKYVLLLDIDEVVVPNHVHTWKELVDEVKKVAKQEKSSYSAQNLYFFDKVQGQAKFNNSTIPENMHMLRHVYRTVMYNTGSYVKSFFNTDQVVTLHNHYPISCLKGCRLYDIPLQYAQLQHYRSDCVNDLKKKCADFKNNTVLDTKIWRYKDSLIKRVAKTLENLSVVT